MKNTEPHPQPHNLSPFPSRRAASHSDSHRDFVGLATLSPCGDRQFAAFSSFSSQLIRSSISASSLPAGQDKSAGYFHLVTVLCYLAICWMFHPWPIQEWDCSPLPSHRTPGNLDNVEVPNLSCQFRCRRCRCFVLQHQWQQTPALALAGGSESFWRAFLLVETAWWIPHYKVGF